MEHELHANSGKGDRPGWLAMDRKTALLEIFYHLAKLQKATKDDDQAGIREYGADVANMAMMLVDICGALDLPSPPTQDRNPLDAGSSRPAMEAETELLPCPFCGGKPRVDLAKKIFCQLHGEPSQAVRVYCYHDCPSRPSVEAGDTFNGGEAKARAVAIAAWNRRALPSAPAVEGVERELVERLEAAIAEAEFGHESPTHVRALVAHLKTATSAISSLQRLVDGIDGERRGALDLCIERNKQIQALDKEISRLTALLAEADQVVKPFSKGPVWDHIDDDAPLTRTAEHGVRISAGFSCLLATPPPTSRRRKMSDTMEEIIRNALDRSPLIYVEEEHPDAKGLDFYLPFVGVHIEVKQFHSERIAEQMSRADNVIAIQGIGAAKLFAQMLAPGDGQ